jgi:predicted ATPase
MANPELPSGTVTFLFTDIEGSTKLLHELGAEHYAGALAEHRRVLRDAFDRNGGVEVDTQGDAFFVAFPTAPGALQAASEGTEGLASGPIRVRMGLHTGTPHLGEEGYVGVDVHRAARIAGCAHGGQVLVSASTAALAGTDHVRDVGEHRLKDLSAPERLYQLGDLDFPPLKSLYRTNLPVPATPFLGREHELAEVLGRLEDARLLTLTGPGGTGKTRLGLQAAAEASDRYPDGVFWVPLAPLHDPHLVLETAGQALGAKDGLADHIADRALLLLLDNFEHVVEAAAGLGALLAACPNLQLLVTSRELLRLPAEQAYPVPPLEPEDGTELFLSRAHAVEPGFVASAAVPELCARLEQLPLALELAAARVRVLSPEQLLDRLSGRLDLLKAGRGVDARQQTLRATIEWSHDLLTGDEQRLFARLAVFAGGCTLDAAEDVCDADLDVLQSLVDKSLLRHTGDRFWMLETIREFAAERFEAAGGSSTVRVAHAEFFASLAERADPHLRHGPDQQGWADGIAAEYDNIRSAVKFALAEAPETALRIVGTIAFFVWLRGGFAEARTWVDEALAAGVDASLLWRGRALVCGAVVAERQGDVEAATRYADEAFAAATAAGDGFGIASALRERGKAAMRAGDWERARTIYEELSELAEEVGDDWNGAVALNNLGDLALYEGDWARVIELCGRSSESRRGLGDLWGAALCLCNVSAAQRELGLLDDAARSLHQALEDSLAVDARMVVLACFEAGAMLAADRNRPQEAATLLGSSVQLREELDTVVEGYERTLLEGVEENTRVLLGEENFARAYEHGRSLPFADVTALALALTE